MAQISQEREVHEFDEISLRWPGELVIVQGEEESLVIEADEALLSKLRCEVRGRRLELTARSWWEWILPPWGPVRYCIGMKQIRLVEMAGSGKLLAERIASDDLRLELSGSGEVRIPRLECRSLMAQISGSGRIELGGEVVTESIQIAGSGLCLASDLRCETAEVRISGSGTVAVAASGKLDVNITGSGIVRYRGQPSITQRITGNGRFEKLA